ncbi:prohead protease/major capsid protein fusion protein [Azospirillum himalayense]|uniref:Prohead protease/major capsid protein fusion protein n=1 Tax=Azospirillum himalayense TaxID=654847 RepID=A0ABW0GGV3_9PROT
MTTPPNGAAPGGAVTERTLPPGVALGWRANGDTSVRAASLEPATFNADARTVELIASTGATVRRFDWWREEYYDEVLTVSAEAVDLTRFEAGSVSILNTHSQWDVKSVLGTGVPGTARFEDGNLILTAKLSARDDVAPTVQDIKDGILRNVSVGYRILAYEVDETTKPQTRKITRWELLEVSFVPVGADGGAGTRSLPHGPAGAPQAAPAPVTVNVNIPDFTRAPAAQPTPDNTKENRMSDTPETPAVTQDLPVTENRGQPQVPPAQTQAAPTAPAPQPEADPLAAMRAAEVDRIAHIQSRAACAQLGLPSDMIARAITEGWSLDTFNRAVIDHVAAQPSNQRNINPHVQVIADEGDTRNAGVVDYINYRVNPTKHKLTDNARQYVGMSLVEVARMYVGGGRGMNRDEIVRRAMHTTSDFPHVLGSAMRRTLRDSYESVALTFAPFSRRGILSDFREMNRVRLGAAPKLLKLGEGGEIKAGSFKDSGASIQLDTYARQLRVTRQMIVNDDLSAFTTVPQAFGGSAARLQNDIVWGLITSNPVLADGKELFHADRKNLAGTGTKLSVTSIASADEAIGQQRDDNEAELGLMLATLLVPLALKAVAATIVADKVRATKADDAVPDYMTALNYVSDPRLTRNSATAWYGVVNPTIFDTLEYAYLEGEEGVQVGELEKVPGVDGLAMEARLDFAAAIIDPRGFYKNPGA